MTRFLSRVSVVTAVAVAGWAATDNAAAQCSNYGQSNYYAGYSYPAAAPPRAYVQTVTRPVYVDRPVYVEQPVYYNQATYYDRPVYVSSRRHRSRSLNFGFSFGSSHHGHHRSRSIYRSSGFGGHHRNYGYRRSHHRGSRQSGFSRHHRSRGRRF